ncbi:MAG: helix-turn-helix domain-containing protein, partial [Longimicrobiales bacterium]
RKQIKSISAAALDALEAWSWPGNVRELRNVIERAMIFASGPELLPADLPPLGTAPALTSRAASGDSAPRIADGLTLPEVEKEYIRRTLEHFDNNIQRSAESLGISRKNLWEKRKKHGLLE